MNTVDGILIGMFCDVLQNCVANGITVADAIANCW